MHLPDALFLADDKQSADTGYSCESTHPPAGAGIIAVDTPGTKSPVHQAAGQLAALAAATIAAELSLQVTADEVEGRMLERGGRRNAGCVVVVVEVVARAAAAAREGGVEERDGGKHGDRALALRVLLTQPLFHNRGQGDPNRGVPFIDDDGVTFTTATTTATATATATAVLTAGLRVSCSSS